mmetsp:Transcript_36726/g.61391  ORF Transcript_36726/g.61391 Transcript_36726/m.61391 type:complete len:108 (+) Transcript_36726:27-350(+)
MIDRFFKLPILCWATIHDFSFVQGAARSSKAENCSNSRDYVQLMMVFVCPAPQRWAASLPAASSATCKSDQLTICARPPFCTISYTQQCSLGALHCCTAAYHCPSSS